MLTRRGATLVELVIAMALASVVLGAASVTVVRLRRDAEGQATRVRTESQVRTALSMLPAALADLAPTAGDLVAGEARDSALQVRGVVASALACDSAVGQVILAAGDSSDDRASGIAVAPRIGDSLWWRPAGAGWTARRVTNITIGTGICAVIGPQPRALMRVTFATPDTVPRGAPLRITRQARYSFYRAGDGTWQLGIADWSEVMHAFAPPQPVAGPFSLSAPGAGRTGFRYFDAAGNELPLQLDGVNTLAVARVRITTLVAEHPVRYSAAVVRRDSVDVALARAP